VQFLWHCFILFIRSIFFLIMTMLSFPWLSYPVLYSCLVYCYLLFMRELTSRINTLIHYICVANHTRWKVSRSQKKGDECTILQHGRQAIEKGPTTTFVVECLEAWTVTGNFTWSHPVLGGYPYDSLVFMDLMRINTAFPEYYKALCVPCYTRFFWELLY
jgi:hypothetical protein